MPQPHLQRARGEYLVAAYGGVAFSGCGDAGLEFLGLTRLQGSGLRGLELWGF